MNKKGQQYAQPEGRHMNPIAVVGVLLIVINPIMSIFKIELPLKGFTYGLGIVLIVVGLIIYMVKEV